MKSLKKKIVALGLALAAMASLSVSAFASDYVSWPAYFVPYRGDCYASTSEVRVQNMKWTATQISEINEKHPLVYSPSMEFEFRTSAGTHSIWESKSGVISTNIPGGKFEFQPEWLDNDDVAVIFPNMKNCVAEQSYYAIQKMTPKNGGVTNATYTFECEVGNNLALDSWPLEYSQYPRSISLGHWGTWEHGGIHV